MKIALQPVLWVKKEDKNGLCPIAIRITGGGSKAYYNTGIKVAPENWTGTAIGKEHDNYDILNTRLDSMMKDTAREILNRELQKIPTTLADVKNILDPEIKGASFLPFAKSVIDGKKGATKKRYEVELDKIKEYAGDRLYFGQITPQWLSKYYKYLTTAIPDKKEANSHNTAINAFKVIRLAFNEAIEQKRTTSYPFDEWKYPQYVKPKRKYLTMAECERIFEILDKPYDADVKLVAAFFLLECFAAIRVSDWNKFTVEQLVFNKDMILTTTKTDTEIRIPIDIMPSLQRVMNYISENKLKFTRDGKFANDTLKLIKSITVIDKHMTTHLARHTFATMWLSKGLSKTAIAAMMGITEKQVATYAHLDADQIRNEITRIGGF